MSTDELHGPNIVTVQGQEFLLTCTGGGSAVHLTAQAPDNEEDRSAVLLRTAIRGYVRRSAGHRLQTINHEGSLYFTCEAVYELHSHKYDRAAADAIGRALQGQELHPAALPDWRLHWDAWSTA